MNTTIEQDEDRLVHVKINGFDLEGTALDVRTILGLDPTGRGPVEFGGQRAKPVLEPKANEKKGTRRTTKKENNGAAKSEAPSDADLPDFDMDEVMDWLIETGQRSSRVGRRPGGAAVRAFLEAKGRLNKAA